MVTGNIFLIAEVKTHVLHVNMSEGFIIWKYLWLLGGSRNKFDTFYLYVIEVVLGSVIGSVTWSCCKMYCYF